MSSREALYHRRSSPRTNRRAEIGYLSQIDEDPQERFLARASLGRRKIRGLYAASEPHQIPDARSSQQRAARRDIVKLFCSAPESVRDVCLLFFQNLHITEQCEER